MSNTADTHHDSITYIGLGPMGQAMVTTLLTAGHGVTVWNRTPSRAADVVAAGARQAGSVAEAIAASDLIVLSLTHYQAMYDILESEANRLSGKTIVNLSSDSPEVTRQAATWATAHGAEFLTGGMMVPAEMVGAESAYAFYSGPSDVFGRYAPILGLFGRPRYVGEEPGLAQAYYQANLTVFLTTLSSVLQATALIEAYGGAVRDFVPDVMTMLGTIPDMGGGAAEVAEQIVTGRHPGDQATVTMMGATADHIVEASRAAGIDTALPDAVKAHYDQDIAGGHGADNWTVLIENIRERRSRPAAV